MFRSYRVLKLFVMFLLLSGAMFVSLNDAGAAMGTTSYNFNGSTQYLTLTDSDASVIDLDVSNGDSLSIECFFRLTASTTAYKDTADTGSHGSKRALDDELVEKQKSYLLYLDWTPTNRTGRIGFWTWDGGTSGAYDKTDTPDIIFNANQWYHVAAVFDQSANTGAGGFTIYLDGVAQTTSVVTPNSPYALNPSTDDSATDFFIGGLSSATPRRFEGAIDEVRIVKAAVNYTSAVPTSDYACDVNTSTMALYHMSDLVDSTNLACTSAGATSDDLTNTGATPTFANIVSFKAKAKNKGIVLKWRTDMELDNDGFNVLRSKKKNGGYVQINDELISSKSDDGEKYKFVDSDIESGKVFYKIEDVDLSGAKTEHGPKRVIIKNKRKHNKKKNK